MTTTGAPPSTASWSASPTRWPPGCGPGRGGAHGQIKVRFGDFRTITRSSSLPVAVDDAPTLLHTAKALLDQVDPAPGVRLLGLSVSGLTEAGARQLTLDDGPRGRAGRRRAARSTRSGPAW